MSESLDRSEVLELLSKGKINIDEAVEMLDMTRQPTDDSKQDEPVLKADIVSENVNAESIPKIKKNDVVDLPDGGAKSTKNDKELLTVDHRIGKPRWLRIRVADLESGKNKVSVNVPFAMIKFGLGVARVFSPEIEGFNLDEIGDMFLSAEEGLLVEVEDGDSNEHVQIYLD